MWKEFRSIYISDNMEGQDKVKVYGISECESKSDYVWNWVLCTLGKDFFFSVSLAGWLLNLRRTRNCYIFKREEAYNKLNCIDFV